MKAYTSIFLLFIAGILVSCGAESTPKVAAPETPNSSETIEITNRQFELGKMELGPMSSQTFHKTIKANGILDVPPENKATVSVYFGGYVKETKLLPGQKIAKGQTLFTIENPDYVQVQQDFLEAKSRLRYLKQDYERQNLLSADNVSSQKTVSKSESDYKIAYAQYESLKKKLSLMGISPGNVTETNLRSTITIAAPISGYVTAVNVTKGMFLNPSDVAVTIMNGTTIHLELTIFEQDLSSITVGQNVKFRLQNSDQHYLAVVHLINKVIDPVKRTVNVHCDLKTASQASLFTPGMYAEAEIETTASKSISLPASTVINIGEVYYALILKSQTSKGYLFERKQVKVGARNEDYVEVLNANDFESSTSFLTSGAFNLIKD